MSRKFEQLSQEEQLKFLLEKRKRDCERWKIYQARRYYQDPDYQEKVKERAIVYYYTHKKVYHDDKWKEESQTLLEEVKLSMRQRTYEWVKERLFWVKNPRQTTIQPIMKALSHIKYHPCHPITMAGFRELMKSFPEGRSV